jgi:G3E family GTPase
VGSSFVPPDDSQVEFADVILLNKKDMLSAAQLDKVEGYVCFLLMQSLLFHFLHCEEP